MNKNSNIFVIRLGYLSLAIVVAFGKLRSTVNFKISFAACLANL